MESEPKPRRSKAAEKAIKQALNEAPLEVPPESEAEDEPVAAGTWTDGETVFRAGGGKEVPADVVRNTAVPLGPGGLSSIRDVLLRTRPADRPAAIDAAVSQYRSGTDGVTWPQIEAYRQRLEALAAELEKKS